MAVTPSTMRDLGTTAPDFSLKSTDGKTVKRNDFADKPMLVMFICNHCPASSICGSTWPGSLKNISRRGSASSASTPTIRSVIPKTIWPI